MKILRVLGLGLAILILRSLLPDVFQAFENTLLQFFSMADTVFMRASVLVDTMPPSL